MKLYNETDRSHAERMADERPDLYSFYEYPGGGWKLVADDGYVADWGDE